MTWEDFNANLARAAMDLPMYLPGMDEHIQRAVAAYMTLGNYGITLMVRTEVQRIWGVTLEGGNYALSSQTSLAFNADADNDGISNLDEWDTALADNQGDPYEALDDYVANALTAGAVGEGEGEGEGKVKVKAKAKVNVARMTNG